MQRSRNYLESIISELNREIGSLVSRSNISNSKEFIQKITDIASLHIDYAQQISKCIIQRSLEVFITC